MLGIGISELVFIFVLIFLLFGPKGLPMVARFLTQFLYEMKHIFQQLEREWKTTSSKEIKKNKEPLNDKK